MERRELLGLMGAGAAGLLVSGSARAVDEHDKKEHGEHEHHHEHMKTIGECALTCMTTSHHCLEKLAKEDTKNREIHAKALAMTNDCQTFCVQAVTLMARHSPLSKYAHQACADACRDCAAACDKGDDDVMKKCAEICRACEKVCRECCKEA